MATKKANRITLDILGRRGTITTLAAGGWWVGCWPRDGLRLTDERDDERAFKGAAFVSAAEASKVATVWANGPGDLQIAWGTQAATGAGRAHAAILCDGREWRVMWKGEVTDTPYLTRTGALNALQGFARESEQ